MNRALVLAEWNRARRSLRSAEVLTREGYYEDAVSRAYYAVLHAAKASLQVHDVAAASHAGVKRLFSLHLIRSGELESEWAGYLGEGQEDRLAADYDAEVNFSRHEAELECHRSREFLNRIERYLQTRGFAASELAKDPFRA